MIKFLKILPDIWRILYLISKYQLITRPGNLQLPIFVRLSGFLCSLLLYPKFLLIKPQKEFGQRLANCFYELGAIYIKFGQTISTRPDLVGEEVAVHLRTLQDQLPPFDFSLVQKKIEKYQGKLLSDIFQEFEEKPVAAASIAQVHKAILKNNEAVAVKILRPDIKKQYQRQITILESLAGLIARYVTKVKRLKPEEILKVFRLSMEFELDLSLEAAAAAKIRDNFNGDENLIVPKIYWHYSNQKILVSEWIEGVSIYDIEAIEKLGLDRRILAGKIAVIFFNQAHRDGFFHADLHPGNILVTPAGHIALIDFGIVGFLPEKDRLAIAEILYGFLQKDYQLVARIHQRVGYIPPYTNLDHFALSCRAIAEPIIGLAIKDISIGNLLLQLFKLTKDYGMEVQGQLILLQKTMLMLEGIGQILDPEINMWQLAEPWIKKWAVKNISPEAKLLRKLKQFFDYL